jgi:hypothetical protein
MISREREWGKSAKTNSLAAWAPLLFCGAHFMAVSRLPLFLSVS